MRVVRLSAITVPLVLGQTADKPRVFVTDSESWEMAESGVAANGAFASRAQAGARSQTIAITKTFGERCPQIVTNNQTETVDYVVVPDREGGKGYSRHRNQLAEFGRLRAEVTSRSTLCLGNSVKDACDGIDADWKVHGVGVRAAAVAPTTVKATLGNN
jgi:hypothetical protein